MADFDSADIEPRALRAWPPAESRRMAGWKLHQAGGFSRRANSAAPPPVRTGIDEVLESAYDWYSNHGLSLVVRITPGVHQIDAALEERGFTKEGLTEVMAMDLEDLVRPAGSSAQITIAEDVPEPWLDVQVRLQPVEQAMRGSWEGILRRIEPAAGFGLLRSGTHYLAAGLAVCDEGWIGLFEVNVEPNARRRGHGSALSTALLDWGAERGAKTAYLQVVADNLAAREMYRTLGFTPAYRYWYRRAPERFGSKKT